MSANESSEMVGRPSPGEQLRRAREQAGISLQLVAERTRISITKLQALERDGYTAVGGTAHITGYARAYARVVGVDANQLIKDIEKALGAEQTRVDAENTLARVNSRKKHKWLYPGVIGLLVVLLAIWIGLWLFSSDGDQSTNVPAVAPTASIVQKSVPRADDDQPVTEIDDNESPMSQREEFEFAPASEEMADRDAISDETVTAPVTNQNAPQSLGQSGTHNNAAEDAGSDGSVMNSPVMNNAAVDGLETGDTEADNTASDSAAEDAAANDAVVEPGAESDDTVAYAPTDQLQVSFIADCWLEVSDATGKTLVADIAKAGETREIVGVAPFNVKFGDVTAVTRIEFNQEIVPFSPRPGRRVLRLTIGE